MRVGTRGSALALAQAGWVADRIPGGELVVLTTSGDRDRASGDKGRWVDTLERALLAGDIDVAVHSAKDVPGALAEGTELAVGPPREDPRDVVVGSLHEGAKVGTSALRRQAQLLAVRPDLEVVELRGNVDTRLRKLADGEVDALVLARAGLLRLGRGDVAGAPLEGEVFVPAAGQGALALQVRAGEPAALSAADPAAHALLLAERATVAALEASCHTPVGVHARGGAGRWGLRGFVGLPDGSEWIVDELESGASTPEAAGAELAGRMLAAGAGDLLARAEVLAA